MSVRRFILAAALWQLGSPLAGAAPLPASSVTVEARFNLTPPDPISTNVLGSYQLTDSRFGTVLVDAFGAPGPLLQVGSNIGPNVLASVFGRGSASLNYGVEVLGPAGQVSVLVSVKGGAAGAATSGASFAVASGWALLDNGTSLAGDDILSGQVFGGSFGQTFGRTVEVVLTTNHLYAVSMLADAAAAATDAGSHASASAFVDPFFALGPGLDPTTYSFLFSDGIGNSPLSVPEPGTLWSMACGLLVLAAIRHRRSAATASGMEALANRPRGLSRRRCSSRRCRAWRCGSPTGC
jgi:hypothetical protein